MFRFTVGWQFLCSAVLAYLWWFFTWFPVFIRWLSMFIRCLGEMCLLVRYGSIGCKGEKKRACQMLIKLSRFSIVGRFYFHSLVSKSAIFHPLFPRHGHDSWNETTLNAKFHLFGFGFIIVSKGATLCIVFTIRWMKHLSKESFIMTWNHLVMQQDEMKWKFSSEWVV